MHAGCAEKIPGLLPPTYLFIFIFTLYFFFRTLSRSQGFYPVSPFKALKVTNHGYIL